MVIAASRNVVATMGFGPNRSAIGDSAITPTTAPPFKSSRKVNALLAAKPLSSRIFGSQVFSLETPGPKLNYGVNKVRFPAPLPVGSKIRVHVSVAEVTDLPAGKQMVLKHTVEIEGSDKPACVAETVVLLLP